MKYEKELLDFIFNKDGEAMIEWIKSKPELEQIDIMRDLKLLTETAEHEITPDMKATFTEFDVAIDKFEDAILDTKLAKQQLIMALEDREKVEIRIKESVNGVREYVIDCVVNNEPNAEEMRALAQQIIAFEKQTGTFDPDNWIGIL